MRGKPPLHVNHGDHPREYGENANPGGNTVEGMGSSPRIRGEWRLRTLILHALGIIPANTGRIYRRYPPSLVLWDHPREYGENGSHVHPRTGVLGSSPRIRGECELHAVIFYPHRIIPANTGRIRSISARAAASWDHPREYGENRVAVGVMTSNNGSSPRIRGESGGGK